VADFGHLALVRLTYRQVALFRYLALIHLAYR
jgi:hypothetical protein